MFKTANVVALCPEETATAPTPPSNCAIFSSKAATVGLLILVYICPSSLRSNKLATVSGSSYL
ncbi:hypothetical protein AK964_22600 [Clostridium butyricum]|nr:hypothetical protein AK964_22600 [Clostridium butyricum]